MRGRGRPIEVVRPDQLDPGDLVRVNGEWVAVVETGPYVLRVEHYGAFSFSELGRLVEVLT